MAFLELYYSPFTALVFVLPHVFSFVYLEWKSICGEIVANIGGYLKKSRPLVLQYVKSGQHFIIICFYWHKKSGFFIVFSTVVMTFWIWIPDDDFACSEYSLPHGRENDRDECGLAAGSGGRLK